MFSLFRKKRKRVNFNFKANRSWVEENFYNITKINHPSLRQNTLITDKGIDFSNSVIYATELTRRIAAGLRINIRQIVVGFSGSLSSAAVVQRDGINYFIEIDKFFIKDKTQIAACLSHEISHVFLKDNNLEVWSNENERYTDLMVICLGMGTMLLNGLNPCKEIETESGKTITRERGIKPYLTHDELGFVMALYAQAKTISIQEIESSLFDTGKDCFRDGVFKYGTRKIQLLENKELESAIILCPCCFQKLRINLNQGEKNISCVNCHKYFKYNTDCYIEI